MAKGGHWARRSVQSKPNAPSRYAFMADGSGTENLIRTPSNTTVACELPESVKVVRTANGSSGGSSSGRKSGKEADEGGDPEKKKRFPSDPPSLRFITSTVVDNEVNMESSTEKSNSTVTGSDKSMSGSSTNKVIPPIKLSSAAASDNSILKPVSPIAKCPCASGTLISNRYKLKSKSP